MFGILSVQYLVERKEKTNKITFMSDIFSNTFHILRPAKAAGFVYAWLELISHRVFIGRMLALTPQQKVCTCVT